MDSLCPPFRSYRELSGHTAYVLTMEFSDDGNFLISGGGDNTVLLWSLNRGNDQFHLTSMETKHDEFVSCLAFSSDSLRIFSGGWDKKVFVHDTNT